MRQILAIVVHHTERDGSTARSIRRYHVLTLGWADAGYHCLVLPTGERQQLRADKRQGAHTPGFNKGTLALVFAGDLDKHPPSGPAWVEAVEQAADWCEEYRVHWSSIFGHRELAPGKTCPGTFVDMQAFRLAVFLELEARRGA